MLQRRSNCRIAWIPRHALGAARAEARMSAPYETGGVLIGYWADGGKQAVVTAVIGPGPNAKHKLFSFRPDYDFQEREIGRLYRESPSKNVYLGDWHTHPNAVDGRLSIKDRRTLWRIATFEEARIAKPLMAVLHGNPKWDIAMWQGRQACTSRLLGLANLAPVEVREYARSAPNV